MPLKDYLEFVEPLRLPCGGKEYPLPPVGVKDGVTLIEGLDPRTETTLTDDALARILLGDQLARMEDDNVPAGFITKAVLTALADFRNGRAAAEEFWATVDDPKALMDRIGQASPPSPASKPSPRTAAGTSTRSRASTTTTTSKTPRPSSPPSTAGAKRAAPSSGSTSSSSGPSSKRASSRRSGSTS